MQFNTATPLVIPVRTAVLLVVTPPERTDRSQRAALTGLARLLQAQLGQQVRVLRIDEVSHPEVVRSFAIAHTPAFILVQQGVELWRQEGPTDAATLTQVTRQVLA